MKLLIVEDNLHMNKALVKGLSDNGFTVDSSKDGKDGLFKAQVNEYDLIILDLNLPEMDGIEVGKKIRSENNEVPILALTARDSLTNKLEGFNTGFDDYLTKPFEFEELIARVNALIRRTKPKKDLKIKFGNILIDPRDRSVEINGKSKKFTKIEYNMLEYLARNKGVIAKNQELVEHIWKEEADLIDPPIRSHIKNIRKKINDNDFTIIKTVPGVGYIIS